MDDQKESPPLPFVIDALSERMLKLERWVSSISDNHAALAADVHGDVVVKRIDEIEAKLDRKIEYYTEPNGQVRVATEAHVEPPIQSWRILRACYANSEAGARAVAEQIAMRAARAHASRPDAPSYLGTIGNGDWRPHAWVVDAVLDGCPSALIARTARMESERDAANRKLDELMHERDSAKRERDYQVACYNTERRAVTESLCLVDSYKHKLCTALAWPDRNTVSWDDMFGKVAEFRIESETRVTDAPADQARILDLESKVKDYKAVVDAVGRCTYTEMPPLVRQAYYGLKDSLKSE